jgi:drug/metabolite transporter (DMT)-like permease
VKWLLVGLIVLCNTAADVLSTHGMKQHGEVRDFGPSGLRRLLAALVRNRYVVGGIAAGALSFFSLLMLLSIANLSFAIPATAASYLVETALARIILKEQITWKRWAGAWLVAGGVALLAFQ